MIAVPEDEYLRTTYEADCEYVAGGLVDRHAGDYLHSRSQALIAFELEARSQERGFRAFIAQRIRTSDEPRYRVPDVCVKAWPHKITPILQGPALAVEILSPDDGTSEILEKIADYAMAGVPYVWLFNPYRRSLHEVVSGVIRRPSTTVLATPLVGEVDFAGIIRGLDRSTCGSIEPET